MFSATADCHRFPVAWSARLLTTAMASQARYPRVVTNLDAMRLNRLQGRPGRRPEIGWPQVMCNAAYTGLAAGQARLRASPASKAWPEGTRHALGAIRCAAKKVAQASPSIAARDHRARRPLR